MMKKIIAFFWVGLMLIAGCKFFNKKDSNGNDIVVAADSTAVREINAQEAQPGLDTITINGKLIRLDSISEAEFDGVKESDPDTNMPAEITQLNGGLNLKLTRRPSFVLEDVIEYSEDSTLLDSYTKYHFGGNYAGGDYWYISADLYEGGVNYLVSKRDGKQDPTVGEPKLSPDKKFFASAQYDMSGESGSGLDLYKIGPDSLVPVFHIYPEWGPDQVKWKDNNTLYIRQYSFNEGRQMMRYAKMNLGGLNLAP
jgi:hypothetical protein